MHRDVDAGTYATDRIDGHLWAPPYWDRVKRTVARAIKKIESKKPVDPFEHMLSSRMPSRWRRNG